MDSLYKNNELEYLNNLKNFGLITLYCKGLRERYEPLNSSIKIPQLIESEREAKAILDNYRLKKIEYVDALNARRQIFTSISILILRITHIYQYYLYSSESAMEILNTYHKIQKIYSSQRYRSNEMIKLQVPDTSFYSRIVGYFSQIIRYIEMDKSYSAINEELSIGELKALETKIVYVNMEVKLSYQRFKKAQSTLQVVFYKVNTGLLYKVDMIRKYIRRQYGSGSEELNTLRLYQLKRK